MKLLVGLGNPGDKYAGTRHNIGFMVADRVAARNSVAIKKKGYQGIYGVGRAAGEETTILLPQTFMNRSGASVNAAFKSLGLTPGDLIVIYDDLDLPLGRIRVRPDGGHGGHNGMRDIIAIAGFKDFLRIKVGIGRPERGDVTGHVLGRFNSDEKKLLPQVLDLAADAAEALLTEGPIEAMNRFNNCNLLDSL
ncbi:peptidyl-tRNA hydrolase [Malonomonas rubra DSM 5091]|uniref:Peptidyl-tRNA hydrolase n=1 Tax=Malonomonas rubra DSM 5091 TaxID=1122189 RepID=A0A1M6E422_MALRU|nr:aminoacyl-tRNA hydrolase [Malonomonas rubra]SHI80155.1 peptidyl-tRNA hydrolase [Malonomonas rubra DSM 5091]